MTTLETLKHIIDTYGDWHGGEVMFIKFQHEYIAALEATRSPRTLHHAASATV